MKQFSPGNVIDLKSINVYFFYCTAEYKLLSCFRFVPLFYRSPLQIHKVSTRAGMRLRRLRRNGDGMRLRRLRRGGEGDKNMRLRRLRRSEIAMDVPRHDFYVVKRPNYETTLRSVRIHRIHLYN